MAEAPFDEDYAYITLEAFLARKPVITANDSGGTLEFAEDGVSGIVCEPRAEAIASAINDLAANRGRAASLTVNDPNPEASHRPILYDSGRPSSVIWFRT